MIENNDSACQNSIYNDSACQNSIEITYLCWFMVIF